MEVVAPWLIFLLAYIIQMKENLSLKTIIFAALCDLFKSVFTS
jgi:hypothetical protein